MEDSLDRLAVLGCCWHCFHPNEGIGWFPYEFADQSIATDPIPDKMRVSEGFVLQKKQEIEKRAVTAFTKNANFHPPYRIMGKWKLAFFVLWDTTFVSELELQGKRH